MGVRVSQERQRARRLQHDTGIVSHAATCFRHALALAFKRVAVVFTSQVDRQMTSEQESKGPDLQVTGSVDVVGWRAEEGRCEVLCEPVRQRASSFCGT